jgi:hypothetical protein
MLSLAGLSNCIAYLVSVVNSFSMKSTPFTSPVAGPSSDAGDSSPQAAVISVTWAGHEFLEASRDEGLWLKAKKAAGAGGGMVLDVLKSVLIGLATEAAKKSAGLP